jgi:hypothetical protein
MSDLGQTRAEAEATPVDIDQITAMLAKIGKLPLDLKWMYHAIRHCKRNMDFGDYCPEIESGATFEPDRQCGGEIAALINVMPKLIAERLATHQKIDDLTRPVAIKGSALNALEWAIGTIASGEIDQEARENIFEAIWKAMVEIGQSDNEIAELRAGLEPFAKAAKGVEIFAPDYPADGAALRASFDWYDKAQDEPPNRHSVRRSDLDRAAKLLELNAPTSRGESDD